MKVNIFRDYKEEQWESMEVYTDNLKKALFGLNEDSLSVKEYLGLPELSTHFSKKQKEIRYFFRYIVNPPLSFLNQGEVNHIIDQSNAHLLSFVDPKKTVITCHDLIVPFWLAEHRRKQKILNFRRKIKYQIEAWRIRQLKKAARIISVSEATKQDIIKKLEIDSSKITVIPEGVEDFFRPIKEDKKIKAFKKKHQLPEKFLLYVGSCEAYKNIGGIIKNFFQIVRHNPDLYLVKVGQFWQSEQLSLIKKLGLNKKIIYLGRLNRRELPLVYSSAKALIQLSFTEGFGLTVLEAMACGCPVIVSTTPALKELVADSGFIVKEGRSKDILEIVKLIMQKKSFEDKCSRKVTARAGQYSWEKTAKLTYRVYANLYQEGR